MEFPFEMTDWEVRYSWDNYHKHTGWLRNCGNGNVVNFSVSSRDVELLNAIEEVVAGLYRTSNIFQKEMIQTARSG